MSGGSGYIGSAVTELVISCGYEVYSKIMTPVREVNKKEYEPTGVRRALNYVGYSAINGAGENEPDIVIRQMVAVTGSRDSIGQVGVFMVQNAMEAAPFAGTISPQISFPVSDFWTKALSFQSSAVRPLEVAPELVELISSGRADPSFITTAVIGIEQVAEYYQRFDQHEEIKVYIQFP